MSQAQTQSADADQTAEAAAAAAFEEASSKLNAQVRDVMRMHIRNLKAPWAKLPQREQQDVISAVETAARDLIRVTVDTVSRRGFDSIGIRLKDLSIKDGRIKGKFEASMTGDNVQLLAEHEESAATIVLADPAAFMRGEWAEADPDQPSMPLGEQETAESEDAEDEASDEDQRRAPKRARR